MTKKERERRKKIFIVRWVISLFPVPVYGIFLLSGFFFPPPEWALALPSWAVHLLPLILFALFMVLNQFRLDEPLLSLGGLLFLAGFGMESIFRLTLRGEHFPRLPAGSLSPSGILCSFLWFAWLFFREKTGAAAYHERGRAGNTVMVLLPLIAAVPLLFFVPPGPGVRYYFCLYAAGLLMLIVFLLFIKGKSPFLLLPAFLFQMGYGISLAASLPIGNWFPPAAAYGCFLSAFAAVFFTLFLNKGGSS